MKILPKLLTSLFCTLLIIQSPSGLAETVELTGYTALQARQKTTCGTLEEGVHRYGVFEGRSYSRVPGQKDKHLFNVMGINVRHCSVVNDEKRGRGYRSVSREIMVYMHPETGEILDTWENPFTGKAVKVLHVANDPVNMRAYRYEKEEDGSDIAPLKLRQYGDMIATSYEIPLFYDNPLGSEYQAYVGGKYHAMEIFNTYYLANNIVDESVTESGQSSLSWSRVAQWLPWMEMGDIAGIMIFNATGFSTLDKSTIPSELLKVLNERYPEYMTPPPLDDSRPNETSWTVFKKYLESKKED